MQQRRVAREMKRARFEVRQNSQVVCLGKDGAGCGSVVEEHHMFEGSQYRKFEGEEDKSHHGE